MYYILSANAKFPTNKLIVKPIPVKTPTPKIIPACITWHLSNFNLIDMYEKTKTPNCFPANKPKTIPNGTLSNSDDKINPPKIHLHLQKQK